MFVLLQIGANDITGRTPYDEIRSTLKRVLAQADTLSTKVVVMTAGNVGLAPAFKWPLSSYMTHRTREVRKIFMEEVAKHPNASYVDLFKERKDEIFNTDIPRYYAPDLFHPSADGYGVWFEQLKKKL
jgi:lysophospholipase L1-like esterase